MQQKTLLERLQDILHYKKSRRYYAEKLGITEDEVSDLMQELRKKPQEEAEIGAYISALEERILEEDLEEGTLKSSVQVDFEPKSVEELYKLHKIDPDKFKITNYWSKLKPGGKFTSSVFARVKEGKDYTPEDFARFLEAYSPGVIHLEVVPGKPSAPKVDVEISIADFHLAKKTLDDDTIFNRKDDYLNILNKLLNRVTSSFRIGTLVFVLSNDFFHTDTYQNTTTNGTPQDVLTSFDHEYEIGFDMLVEALTTCLANADRVEVVLVQGNHDRTKSFYLAHALEVFFKNNYAIRFQREHSTTKHVVLGNTFIGYHHGNCKIDDLPLLFATGATASDFGNSRYREVHTGDKHHYMAKEIKGVRIQQMPSLSGVDRWHRDNNYVNNVRAALLLIYDQQLGKIGEYEERI